MCPISDEISNGFNKHISAPASDASTRMLCLFIGEVRINEVGWVIANLLAVLIIQIPSSPDIQRSTIAMS
jgi:hypothetical protein